MFDLTRPDKSLRQHNAVVYREGVCGETSDVPGSNLHLVTQCGDEREVVGTRDPAFFHRLDPRCNLVLLHGRKAGQCLPRKQVIPHFLKVMVWIGFFS